MHPIHLYESHIILIKNISDMDYAYLGIEQDIPPETVSGHTLGQ